MNIFSIGNLKIGNSTHDEITGIEFKQDVNPKVLAEGATLLGATSSLDFNQKSYANILCAIDRYNNAWELKTVNVNLTNNFLTNHHTNLERITVFLRNVGFLVYTKELKCRRFML